MAERNYAFNAEYNFLTNRNIVLRPEQAIRDFDYVLEVAHDHALAMWGKGKAYNTLGRFEESIKWFRKALGVLEKEWTDPGISSFPKGKDSTTMKSISMSFVAINKDTKYLKYFQSAGIDISEDLKSAHQKLNI